MIEIINAPEIICDTNEVLRYLGFPRGKSDENTLKLIEECKADLIKQINLKACVKRVKIIICGDEIDLGFKVKSKALSKNLEGCDEAVLFCATIGAAADRMILKYVKTEPSKAVVYDAVASDIIEQFCKYINGLYKGKPRFSCGFGDFGLSYQHYFIEQLDTARKIGVTLTEGNLMLPTKSVTAVIGIK